MDDPRTFTADLLDGRRTHIDDQPMRTRGSAPDAVLRDTAADLDALEAERARDPQAALAMFRELLHDPALTDVDLTSFLDVWRTAVARPDEFAARVEEPPTRATRGPSDWWDALRAYLHRPQVPSARERELLDNLAKVYRFPSSPAPQVNPHERRFENPDPAWARMWRMKLGERHWPEGLAAMPRHRPPDLYVYDAIDRAGAPLAGDAPHTVALFADFGTGYYHSWGIAQQLAAWGHPYSFHLGDVYYAGEPDEFVERFAAPLDDVVTRTRLFGFAENHELYSGGQAYLTHFATLRANGLTPQEGSYYCVRFPRHQILGIDVNWQGRRRYRDPGLRAWLADRLAEAGGRTNILLTGSAPFDHGDASPRDLLGDLSEFLDSGAIGLWFWGDDHYAALYDRFVPEPGDPRAPLRFYGSCIGHGGFPGARQRASKATCQTSPLWLEDTPRFPEWTHLRDDVTNNGWCQMTLRPDGGVDLLYIDWLWCKRARATFDREGAGLRLATITSIDRDDAPELHVPPAPT